MKVRKIFMLQHLSSYINSLGDALCDMGHRLYYQSSWDLKEIEAGIAHFQPDILVTVGYDRQMMDAVLDKLPELCRTYKLTHLYWATEDRIHYDTISLPYVLRAKPDIIWTIHPACVADYRALGFQADYVNFGFNPRIFKAKPLDAEEPYDVAFVGSTHLETKTLRYESIRQLVMPVVEAGLDVHIWGHGWQDNDAFVRSEFGSSVPSNGYLAYKHTVKVYHNSKIMLGVQNASDQVTQRTFEILGTGAFMIASRTDALEELFTDGVELALSSGPEETLEKIDFYLNRPDLRRKIGRQARRRVLDGHTYAHRIADPWNNVCRYADASKECVQ